MVVRREIAEKHPWVVLNLLKAFEKANEIANAQRMEHVELSHRLRARSRRRRRRRCASRCCATASRPTARSWKRRRRYSLEQGLTPRLMKLEEVFAPSAMDQ